MKTQYEISAFNAGWFDWFGVWLHIYPLQSGYERPPYFIGTARDLCLSQGLFTGEPL